MKVNNYAYYKKGIKSGMPIFFGYFAVSFALGITCKNAGISVIASTLMSFLNVTSAGQAAAIGLISAGTTILELCLCQLVINSRYFLMSSIMSAKLEKNTPFYYRFIIAMGVTDEIFCISTLNECVNPFFCFGAISVALPGWTLGTFFGVLLGNIMPSILIDSLSVALYGMFIAIVIPPLKEVKPLRIIIPITMLVSYIFNILDIFKFISEGFKIVIITIIISSIASIVFPVKTNE